MSKKILLVDANRDHRRLYIQALSQANFDVAGANNAQAALDALDEFQPNLLVTEVNLPTYNGLTILKEVFTYEDWKNIPIVVLSSVEKDEFDVDDSLWQRMNVVEYCFKADCLPHQFAQTIAKILS